MTITGDIVDIRHRDIFNGRITLRDGRIASIERLGEPLGKGYILPGFIDSHVHIESSMLTPARFGEMVVGHGTVAVVTDPHEIANVAGMDGICFMRQDSLRSPIRTFFTIPSCVPATHFDRSGGEITPLNVERMVSSGGFVALSEIMNVPGVLTKDEELMAKIHAAQSAGLPLDGHAPMLSGRALERYIAAGITTDHESSSLDEATEKIARGMKILIREGSAARNYQALKPLIGSHPDRVMFCTDDSHPDDIITLGHIDKIVRRAVADGFDLFDVLRIACLNPAEHYRLGVGTLQEGDPADFIVVNDLRDFRVKKVYIGGEQRFAVAAEDSLSHVGGETFVPASGKSHSRDVREAHSVADTSPGKPKECAPVNRFRHNPVTPEQLRKEVSGTTRVISVQDGEIITRCDYYTPDVPVHDFVPDTKQDILKIVYIDRYRNGTPQVALCKGFGLREGALAGTVAHDSHNIIAVGCSDRELVGAINAVIAQQGGLALCCGENVSVLPLPVGGIMCDRDGKEVAQEYGALNLQAKRTMGCTLRAPFMTLSFLSLIVIPELKIGEKGLFRFDIFDWENP